MVKKGLITVFLLLVFITAFAQKTITYGVRSWDVDYAKKEIAAFNKVYPDIKVEMIVFDQDLNQFLTQRLAAKQPLPDVMTGWEGFTFIVSQGLALPLNQFVKTDPDWKYVPQAAQKAFEYNSLIYAIPWDVHFNMVVVNLDLLKQLNLPKPSYNWTVEEFVNLARRGTTREYSGINHLWEFDTLMAGVFDSKVGTWSFDPQLHKFRLVNGGWIKALELQKQLKSIPGLVSDDLKNQELRDKGQLDDYQKKFGKDADAFRESKVLMGWHGTWDWWWIKTVPWNFDFYPLPQVKEIGVRMPLHVNYVLVASTTKNPKEAFTFAKFISYSPKGIVERLDLRDKNVDAQGNPDPVYFIPATRHPDVVAKFNSMKAVPDGVKFMLQNIDKTFKADFWKTVPGWDQAAWEVIFPAAEQVRAGKSDPKAVAADIESKANRIIQEAKKEFDERLAKLKK